MQQIIDTLTPGCGPVSILFRIPIGAELTKTKLYNCQPLPHQPLWQCFLSGNHHPSHSSDDGTAVSQISQIGIDSAKLHCCHKALSPKCRRVCSQTYSNGWTETRDEFDNDCYSDLNEISLRQCIDEGKSFNCQEISNDLKFNFIFQWLNHVSSVVMDSHSVRTLTIDQQSYFAVAI